MVKYKELVTGKLVRKVNRFIAEVEIDDVVEAVHIKTTGRLAELMLAGAPVVVEPTDNPARKTKYSLIGIEGVTGLVNVDSQLSNRLMWEALQNRVIEPFGELDVLRKEVKYGGSRFDLYYERGEVRGFVELKGVTYADGRVAKFPDAPSERARKHVAELIEMVGAGYEATVLFVVQVPGCSHVAPYEEMDPHFAGLLRKAVAKGVRILAYEAVMRGNDVLIGREMPVHL